MKHILILICLLQSIVSSPLNDRSGALRPIQPVTPADDDTQKHRVSERPSASLDHVEHSDYTLDIDASGISPGVDTGRSKTVDHQAQRHYCPRFYLEYRKCPLDPRCRAQTDDPSPHQADSSPPWPKPRFKPNRPWIPHNMGPDPGEPAAIAGPQIAGFREMEEEREKKKGCLLQRCELKDGQRLCHNSTTCYGGLCVCGFGFKSASGEMANDGGTVFVDAGVVCDVPCKWLFCAEVEEARECFKVGEGGPQGEAEAEAEEDKESLEEVQVVNVVTSDHYGAVHVTGAVIDGYVGDYFASIVRDGKQA